MGFYKVIWIFMGIIWSFFYGVSMGFYGKTPRILGNPYEGGELGEGILDTAPVAAISLYNIQNDITITPNFVD